MIVAVIVVWFRFARLDMPTTTKAAQDVSQSPSTVTHSASMSDYSTVSALSGRTFYTYIIPVVGLLHYFTD